MLARARDGAVEGSWLYADEQSGGRGRQGRRWVSPSGNLYASGLVRVQRGDPPAPTLALVAGVAVWDVVAGVLQYLTDAGSGGRSRAAEVGATGGKRLYLKWPNDLVINDAKLAGILLEREGDAVVIGVGLNLVHHPDLSDRTATNLAALGVNPPSAAEAVEALALAVARWLIIWRTLGLSEIISAWIDRAHLIGTPLAVDSGQGGRLAGQFAGLDASGALKLSLADGSISVIHAGDVFLM